MPLRILYHTKAGLVFYRVKILGVIPGMQSTIIKYAEDNKLKFPHIDYALAGGQIISRGFKEKLVRVLKGRIWVGQLSKLAHNSVFSLSLLH